MSQPQPPAANPSPPVSKPSGLTRFFRRLLPSKTSTTSLPQTASTPVISNPSGVSTTAFPSAATDSHTPSAASRGSPSPAEQISPSPAHRGPDTTSPPASTLPAPLLKSLFEDADEDDSVPVVPAAATAAPQPVIPTTPVPTSAAAPRRSLSLSGRITRAAVKRAFFDDSDDDKTSPPPPAAPDALAIHDNAALTEQIRQVPLMRESPAPTMDPRTIGLHPTPPKVLHRVRFNDQRSIHVFHPNASLTGITLPPSPRASMPTAAADTDRTPVLGPLTAAPASVRPITLAETTRDAAAISLPPSPRAPMPAEAPHTERQVQALNAADEQDANPAPAPNSPVAPVTVTHDALDAGGGDDNTVSVSSATPSSSVTASSLEMPAPRVVTAAATAAPGDGDDVSDRHASVTVAIHGNADLTEQIRHVPSSTDTTTMVSDCMRGLSQEATTTPILLGMSESPAPTMYPRPIGLHPTPSGPDVQTATYNAGNDDRIFEADDMTTQVLPGISLPPSPRAPMPAEAPDTARTRAVTALAAASRTPQDRGPFPPEVNRTLDHEAKWQALLQRSRHTAQVEQQEADDRIPAQRIQDEINAADRLATTRIQNAFRHHRTRVTLKEALPAKALTKDKSLVPVEATLPASPVQKMPTWQKVLIGAAIGFGITLAAAAVIAILCAAWPATIGLAVGGAMTVAGLAIASALGFSVSATVGMAIGAALTGAAAAFGTTALGALIGRLTAKKAPVAGTPPVPESARPDDDTACVLPLSAVTATTPRSAAEATATAPQTGAGLFHHYQSATSIGSRSARNTASTAIPAVDPVAHPYARLD